MDVTFNNTGQNGIVVFDGVPNIVTVGGMSYQYSPAQLIIGINTFSAAAGYTLTINGETVTSVVSQEDAGPREFGTDTTAVGVCNNICKALRAIPSIVTSYDVQFNSRGSVIVRALGAGDAFAITYSCDIPLAELTYDAPSMSSDASVVNVAVSSNSPSASATLSKRVAGPSVSFDISPVLHGMTTWGGVTPFVIQTYVEDLSGDVTYLPQKVAKVVRGRHAKGCPDYQTGEFIAQPLKGAPDRDVYNSVVLYALKGRDFPLSWYSLVEGQIDASIELLDSSFSVLRRGTVSFTQSDGGIGEFVVPAAFSNLDAAWYVSVVLPDDSVVRYNLIRDNLSGEATRLYWRNALGGISFFDFTGSHSSSIDLDSSYMYDEGSSYGYYTDEYRHDEILWQRSAKKTHTVESRVIDGAGVPILDDLAGSGFVWIEEDGVKYYVIVTKVEAVKVSSNGTYRLKVSYEYSIEGE